MASGRQDLLLALGVSLIIANAVADGGLATIWGVVKNSKSSGSGGPMTGKSKDAPASSAGGTGLPGGPAIGSKESTAGSQGILSGAPNDGSGIANTIGSSNLNPVNGVLDGLLGPRTAADPSGIDSAGATGAALHHKIMHLLGLE